MTDTNTTIETADLAEAAFFQLRGYPVRVEWRGPRCFLIFSGGPELLGERDAYLTGAATVPACAFAARLDALKQLTVRGAGR